MLLINLMNQAVIASASAEGEAFGIHKLKHGLRIIVQTADNARIHLKRYLQLGQELLKLREMRLALLVQIVDGPGRILDNFPALGHLAVDDAHGIFLHSFPAGRTQSVLMLSQIGKQRFVVILLAVRAADAVDMKLYILQPQFSDEGSRQGNHFHLSQRTLGAHKLHAELVMLAETPALGLLITESLRHIVQLCGGRVGIHIMLQISAHGSRRAFRLQRNASVALILKGIHFLLHHVRSLAHAALKQHGVLKHRGNNLSHIVGACQFSCLALHPRAPVHPLAVPVFHSSWSLCNHMFSSSVIRTSMRGSSHFS